MWTLSRRRWMGGERRGENERRRARRRSDEARRRRLRQARGTDKGERAVEDAGRRCVWIDGKEEEEGSDDAME